ncbi:hypothetical protein ZIOFF_031335 [Zingiber officinale]|uniref:Amidohydrolase 3 domain-containing protein n=1 Tax=Zingiber officinale TaxID=94328 RepID=A0A8J5GLA0_ZINOF|nr:hypothetical protein ZIOFF_031335 [Zingiber officinale]
MANTVLVLISVVAAAFLAIILAPLRYPEWIPPRWFRISADMVVMNATIYTSDPSLPFAQAMAVRDGRILRVGSYSSIKGLIGHGTSQLNLNGKVVVPGFIDSHVHLLFGGLQMAQVLLRGIKSREEFVRLVQEALRGKDVGEWILGGQWNNDNWGGDLPLSSWIDSITPDNPVWLSRTDGHMGLANSLALKIAGISNRTSDPVGGTIMKNLDGDPSGLLVDSAMKLVLAVIPEVSVKERRDALLRASKYAVSRGVTTVVDMGRFFPGASVHHVWHDFSDVYQWADSSGKMLIRVCLFFPLQTCWKLTAKSSFLLKFEAHNISVEDESIFSYLLFVCCYSLVSVGPLPKLFFLTSATSQFCNSALLNLVILPIAAAISKPSNVSSTTDISYEYRYFICEFLRVKNLDSLKLLSICLSEERICAYASGKFNPIKSTIDAEIHAVMNSLIQYLANTVNFMTNTPSLLVPPQQGESSIQRNMTKQKGFLKSSIKPVENYWSHLESWNKSSSLKNIFSKETNKALDLTTSGAKD